MGGDGVIGEMGEGAVQRVEKRAAKGIPGCIISDSTKIACICNPMASLIVRSVCEYIPANQLRNNGIPIWTDCFSVLVLKTKNHIYESINLLFLKMPF